MDFLYIYFLYKLIASTTNYYFALKKNKSQKKELKDLQQF